MKRSHKISDYLSVPKCYPMKRNVVIAKCILTSTVGEEEWPVSSSGCFTVEETGLMCPKTRMVMVAKRKIVTPLGIEQLLPVTQPSPTLHILAILRQRQNTIYRVMQNPFQTRCWTTEEPRQVPCAPLCMYAYVHSAVRDVSPTRKNGSVFLHSSLNDPPPPRQVKIRIAAPFQAHNAALVKEVTCIQEGQGSTSSSAFRSLV